MQDRALQIVQDPRITVYGRLLEAWVTVTRQLDAQLEREVGIPLTWYGVLLLVGRSPGGARPIGELGLVTALTSGGVTRLVDRMAVAGLVERVPCPTDRRVIWVRLTDPGKELLVRATEVHLRGIQEYMLDKLAPEEVAELSRILAKLGPGQ
jgi:MarR family transcriptional regulator, 2-MHQ and catechol-resistance regulon repressor